MNKYYKKRGSHTKEHFDFANAYAAAHPLDSRKSWEHSISFEWKELKDNPEKLQKRMDELGRKRKKSQSTFSAFFAKKPPAKKPKISPPSPSTHPAAIPPTSLQTPESKISPTSLNTHTSEDTSIEPPCPKQDKIFKEISGIEKEIAGLSALKNTPGLPASKIAETERQISAKVKKIAELKRDVSRLKKAVERSRRNRVKR